MNDRNITIKEALSPLFWWAKEPVLMATAFTSAVIATIDYFEMSGRWQMDDALLVLVIAWINIIGLVIRSQYTPYANQ